MSEKDEKTEDRSDYGRPLLSLNIDLDDATAHPDRIAASVAVSFYKELRRHRFNNNQIVKVATELIGCLNKSLEGYKKKMEKDKDQGS